MNKKRLAFLLIGLIGIAGAVLSVVMLVSAIQFKELGRVILYLVTTVVCVEMTILSFLKAFPKKEQ